jgi:hypothetical protein
MTITFLYQGFDGLDLAYRGEIRAEFAEILEVARNQACDARSPQLVFLNGIAMHVKETGARGGYRYGCDTGPLGATWFLAKPRGRNNWGVRVSVKSAPLALSGVDQALASIEEIIAALTGGFKPDNVSLSRVDYALDYLIDEFTLDPDCIVMPGRMKRHADREASEVGYSGRLNSIRVGKMPGRQVAIYDKRADALAKSKTYWWDIWNAQLEASGHPPISAESTKEKIWRIELRAGKSFLREHCDIRTWEDFKARGASMFSRIASEVRYAVPTGDQNRARWPSHLVWIDVTARIAAGLKDDPRRVPIDRFSELARDELVERLDQQILGCCASLAVALKIEDVEISDLESLLASRIARQIADAPSRFREKLAAAADRHHFL